MYNSTSNGALDIQQLTIVTCRRTLSLADRKSYISALKCVMGKPSLTSRAKLPGARSRYDDFLGVHILQADNVHFGVRIPPTHARLHDHS